MAQNTIAPELKLRHIFGLKPNVTDAVHYIEDNVVMYPVGRRIVMYDTETRKQRFIIGEEKDTTEITAMTVSLTRRTFAVAFRSVSKGIINIYDVRTLKLRNSLVNPEVASTTCCSLRFSPDNKYLISMGGTPDFILTLWEWSSNKVLQSESINAKTTGSKLQCSFSPYDPKIIVVTGYKLINFFKIESDHRLQLIDTKEKATGNYICHEWIAGNRLVMGTESGEVIFFENFTAMKTISMTSDGAAINCIKVCSRDRSLMVGTASGKVEVIQRQHKEENIADDLKKDREFVVQENPAAVCSLAISLSGDKTCIMLDNSQVYVLSSFNADVLNPREMLFEPLGELGHHGAITGLDICWRKPLIVTCGADMSVRVWDYVTNTLENVKRFSEKPLCVAFHPSGFHVVIGFPDKLRFFNLLMDDLRPVKDFPLRGVREVKFANGGHLFAAAQNSVIHIFETFTCKIRVDLSLRYHNGRVISLFWSRDDESICSTGADGAVYLGRLGESTQRLNEFQQKGCRFTCALASNDQKMYVVGKGSKILEIMEGSVTNEIDGRTNLTQICIGNKPQRFFFSADADGGVWSYKYPFAGLYRRDYVCHAGSVTRMCISPNNEHLFTVAEDGSLALWDVHTPEYQTRELKRDEMPWSEEVMVTKTDLEEKHLNMQRLEGRVNILMLQNDSKLRQHENQYQENLQDSTQRYQLKLEEQKNKFQALRDEKADMMVDFQEKEKQFLKWSKQRCEKLDMMNQSTLRDQIKNYQDTESAYQESKHKFKKDLKNMEDRHTEAMADSQRLHEERHRKAVERVEKAREDKDNIIRQFNETTRQLELDTDLEIERLKTKYESMLAVEKEAKMRLKGENGIMKKRFSSLEKQIVDQNEEIKEIEETSELLEDKVSDLQTEITRLKKRIKKMDQTISERETQIYDLKKNIGELEKHKFVLDYSIKQQNLQIEPREKEISNMKNDVLRLDGDLERLHKENGELTDEIQHLKKKMGEKQRTDKFKRQKLNRIKNDLEALKKGIRIVVELIQHPNKLRAGVQRLCKSYMKITETQEKVASTVQGEYDKQKEHLKKTVKVLKKKLRLESEARRKNVVAVLKENMMLLNEIKELRENLKKLKQMVYDEEPLNNDSYSYTDPEAEKIVQLQRDQIESLRKEIDLVTERLGLDSGGAISKQRAQVV